MLREGAAHNWYLPRDLTCSPCAFRRTPAGRRLIANGKAPLRAPLAARSGFTQQEKPAACSIQSTAQKDWNGRSHFPRYRPLLNKTKTKRSFQFICKLQKRRTLIEWSELTMPLAVDNQRVVEDFTNQTVRQRRASDDSGYSPKSNSPTETVPANGSVR